MYLQLYTDSFYILIHVCIYENQDNVRIVTSYWLGSPGFIFE